MAKQRAAGGHKVRRHKTRKQKAAGGTTEASQHSCALREDVWSVNMVESAFVVGGSAFRASFVCR